MELIYITWAVVLVAMTLAYRVRGGYPATGSTTLARAIAAVVTGGTAYLLTFEPWAFAAAAIFATFTLPHGQWQDMNYVEENDDFTGMWGREMINASVPALVLESLGYHGIYMIPAVGFAVASGYWVAWKALSWVRVGRLIDGPTSIGELLRGFFIGAGMLGTVYFDVFKHLAEGLLK